MSLTTLKFPQDHKISLPVAPISYLQCDWLDECVTDSSDLNAVFNPLLSISPVLPVEVHNAKILTKGEDVKKKIEITFDTKDFECNYLPGDTIGIYPLNPLEEVNELIKLLNLEKESAKYFKIEVLKETTKKNAVVPKHLPSKTCLKDLFRKFLDIRSPIKKTFLRSLCHYTTDVNERRRLEELSSKEGMEDYNKYILSDGATLATILKSFRSCKPTISLLLEQLPPIKPRVYSIASSLKDRNLLRIVVTIVENENNKGICSGFLYNVVSSFIDLENKFKNLNLSNEKDEKSNLCEVPIFFRQPNNFRYPDKEDINQIMICAGSGIAPFIGFLEHKEALKKLGSNNVSETWLFFGCRNDNDYIYRKELEEYLSKGILNKLFVSFSRISSNDSPKYVQDSVIKVKDDVMHFFLNKEAIIYICGDAKNMVKEVLNVIKLSLQTFKGISESESDSLIKEYCKNGRIITDSWI